MRFKAIRFTRRHWIATAILTACGLLAARHADAAESEFSYELPAAATTSAGVYDAQGRLVRVLWTVEKRPAGKATAQWDGQDQFGKPAPSGTYEFRVVVDRATYENVGAIGNSGRTPAPADHTPTGMSSVAVDAEGAIYTANGWDEAGADFTKWDANGNVVYDGRYQMRNGQPNGAPYSIAVDRSTIYCGMEGWASKPWNHKQQVQRFALADGKLEKFTDVSDKFGHIELYEWPERQVPAGTLEADAELMRMPLRSLAVAGNSLLVADALSGKIRRFDKATGRAEGEFQVRLPQALAVDREGRIWVGHEHSRLSVFSPEGKRIAEPLGQLGEIVALAFGPDSRLYVADRKAGQVLIYKVTENHAASGGNTIAVDDRVERFGQPAKPGDRAADHFFELRGVAVDPHGFMATIQTEPAGGARVARWSPDKKLVWEQFGCEFVSLGKYGADDPATLYSMTFHRYHLADHKLGHWQYTGCMIDQKPAYKSDVHGVPRLLKFGEHKFWFMPTGDGVQVYRIDETGGMRLAAILGSSSPDVEGNPRGSGGGQWSWSDTKGDGKLLPAEVQWFKKPGQQRHAVFGVDVDSHGDAWFGELNTHAIWTVAMAGLNAAGNPTYDWSKGREAVPKDTSPLEFQANMAQRADDGSIYALGWSKPWPSPKGNPFWMGGTTLVRFDKHGERLWAVPLPEVSVGMDTIPGGGKTHHGEAAAGNSGGGCIVGTGKNAALLHYNADGLLIGRVSPGTAMAKQSGWFDNHACVAVNRDRRDGILDVFTEDDFALRIGWYRIDDRNIDVLSGAILRK
ncbi:MAG TPA: FlgD immunoglobulin-like domain containing protein [Pirellulales bacterium]|nr:FlgD immunoglobulin-like domain containing protein [Pirellulales bacterium]